MTADRWNWSGFERALHDGIVAAVAAAHAERPDERLYAAALSNLYRETDGVIGLPSLGVNSVEALDGDDDVRWSPADWDRFDDEWLGEDATRSWAAALTAHARAGTPPRWDAVFRRYLTALVRAARKARATLRADGVTDRDFVVVVLDDQHHAELIRRTLPAADVRRLFPELDEQTAARRRLAALPPAERAAELVALLDRSDGPLTWEDAHSALRELGADATPALLTLLGRRGRAWSAAKLLADIGRADDDVVRALTAALGTTDGSDQSWTAVALARLGRLDLVLERADALPTDSVVSAVAGPYTGFRDDAADPPTLDYRPLAEVLETRPALAPGLDEQLGPGKVACAIRRSEVDTAVRALGSPHPIIRRHAVEVLGERRLGRAAGRRVLPALSRVVRADPDPVVRRLAVLSLLWWEKDSRHLADEVRAVARDDADPAVRAAAGQWLDEQGLTG